MQHTKKVKPTLKERFRRYVDDNLKKYFPSIWQIKEQRNIDKLADLFECEFDVSKKDSKADIEPKSIETIAQTDTQCFSSGGMVIGMKKLRGGKELFYYIGDDTHLLGIGATRSGKSRTLVIQSICFLALAGEV